LASDAFAARRAGRVTPSNPINFAVTARTTAKKQPDFALEPEFFVIQPSNLLGGDTSDHQNHKKCHQPYINEEFHW